MGSHRKQTRNRLKYLLPGAAGTALVGMTAAACLAPQAMAEPQSVHTVTQPAAAAQPASASYMSDSTAHLLAATRETPAHQARAAQAVKYTVRSGDSLSAIAGRVYHNPDAWPVLYWANHSHIRWANIITAGQVLQVPAKPAKIPGAPGQLGPAPVFTPPGPGPGPGPCPGRGHVGQPGVRARAVHRQGGEHLLRRVARRLVRSVRHRP